MKRILMYVANRIWLILGIYLVSLLLGAALFSHFEAKGFADGIWWAAVTALTIGYGDLSPVTPAGRTAGIVFGHFWIFVVIPMIIANIIMHVIEDKNLFTDEEQRELMERLCHVEALLAAERAQGADALPPAPVQRGRAMDTSHAGPLDGRQPAGYSGSPT
ncbi:MAG: two pore domain potassium channel family protein [Haliea sp.]|nr:MAG: two pore domain potassium channel family protein [Haliea sp.]